MAIFSWQDYMDSRLWSRGQSSAREMTENGGFASSPGLGQSNCLNQDLPDLGIFRIFPILSILVRSWSVRGELVRTMNGQGLFRFWVRLNGSGLSRESGNLHDRGL